LFGGDTLELQGLQRYGTDLDQHGNSPGHDLSVDLFEDFILRSTTGTRLLYFPHRRARELHHTLGIVFAAGKKISYHLFVIWVPFADGL
jgi:hypothetical protein